MTIEIDIRRRLGDFRLDIRFTGTGRLTAIFGRSGSGKTSLVDLVAGLGRPDGGRIAVDGVPFADTAAGIFAPPHRRRIGYVFQDARLFPHMSVRSNLAYGSWFAGAGADRPQRDRIVALLGIGHLLSRRPAALSGGERQRVAIGRALLSRPRLLLMDEPLAALDEARKSEILPYIERLRDEAGVPILYVSHSIAEVVRLADDMVMLEAGRVVAQGPPREVMRRLDLLPAAAEVEAGCPLDAVVTGQDDRYGLTVLAHPAGPLFVPRLEAAIGTSVRMQVRARDVMLSLGRPDGLSALNALPAEVAGAAPDGPAGLLVRLDCGGQELLARVTRRSFETMGLRAGSPVHAVLKAVSFDRRYGAPDAGSEIVL